MKKTILALSLVTATAFAGHALAEGHEGKGPRHHRGDHMFEQTDTNKDGVVTKAEFRAQGDKLFAKLDTNGDGKITKEERDARRAEFKAKRAAAKAAE